MKSFIAIVLTVAFTGCTNLPQNQAPPQECNEEWYTKVESVSSTGDGQGHGPDLATSEWKGVVEFDLGLKGNPEVPDRDSEEWCDYIDQHLKRLNWL